MKSSQCDVDFVYVIILGWDLHFKIIQSILSRTDERIVESRDICGHLKRRIFFIIDSKK